MGDPEGVLACADWGRQRLPSLKANCELCHKAIAYEKGNEAFVKEQGLKLMCVDCALKFGEYVEQRRNEKTMRSLLHNGQVTPLDDRN
jgi:ribosome-binding protein aMBF1 (putative translation factor)